VLGTENLKHSPNGDLTRWRYCGPPGGNQKGEPMQLITRLAKDESAATAIEYGLIAAGISVVIIAAVNGLGVTLNGTFTSINTQLR
jgi:pilus assembly protein Flp/PilA